MMTMQTSPASPTASTSPSWKNWLPVISLAFSAFIFNTTEFAPIGLLTDISKTFGMPEETTGLMITGYAWFVALASLPLMLLTARIERKKLLIALFVIFIASHVLSALAKNFSTLMVARIGIASAHAVFWSITAPLAFRLAPNGYKAKALSFLVAGSSLATILGLPLGRIIGQHLGWQITFVVIGALALIVLFVLIVTLPTLPSSNAGSAKSLPLLLKRPTLLGLYLITVLLVTGHFTSYSYIEPFLQKIAGFSENFTTVFLLVSGVSGIIGSIIYTKINGRYSSFSILVIPIAIVSLCMLLMRASSAHMYTMIALCSIWGVCLTAIFMSLQTRVLENAPDATDIATAIYSGIFNVGIGGGALIGSQISSHIGMGWIGYVGAVFAMSALVIAFVFLPRKR